MAETLKQKTARGLFWGGMSNGIQQLLGVVFGIVLGRLLSPGDYGMIAMVTVFSLIANELQWSGFKTALTNLKSPTHRDYNSVFWFNIIVAAAIYVVLFFSAPLIAAYYHKPELVPLCRYLFVGFVLASIGGAQSAYLFKNLMARQQAVAGVTALVLSNVVGVVMAWQGYSYWSLATQSILYVGTNTVLFWCFSPWRPSFKIDLGPIRGMIGFSVKIMATAIVNIVNNNILNVLLGRYFTAAATGFYYQAYQWNYKAYNLLQGMAQQVAQPVLVEVGDERDRELRVLRKMVRFTAMLSFPLLLGLSLVSHEFIVVTLTAKWEASAELLRVMCLGGAFMPVSLLLYNCIISHGRSGVYLWCTVAFGAAQLCAIMLCYPLGIKAMVMAYAALNVVWVLVWHFFVRRLTGYRLTMLLADVAPFALAAGAVMVLTHFATAMLGTLWVKLVVRILLAAALYCLVMKVARVKIFDEALRFVLRRKA